MADRLLDIEETAQRINTPVGTLRFWRHKNVGPPSALIGRRLMYRESELEAWIEAQFAGTSAGPRAPRDGAA